MQLRQTSETFRIFFLAEFTKELIENSKNAETIALEKLLHKRVKENLAKIEREKEIRNLVTRKTKFFHKKTNQQILSPLKQKYKFKKLQKVQFPRQNLPSTVQNLTPQATNIQIDLGKLNALVKDPTVTAIECNGPDKNILIRRIKQVRKTPIILSKEEIDQIIQNFSKSAKIPVQEGIFKVAIGRLVINAIISELVDTKFIIEKIMQVFP